MNTIVFRPNKKVSSALKHRLWAKLIEMGMVYRHDIPHSFLMQHANDEKLNEKILSGIEKMANKDTIDFWPYAMKTRITEMTKILGFSEKQVQRLLKAADKFDNYTKRNRVKRIRTTVKYSKSLMLQSHSSRELKKYRRQTNNISKDEQRCINTII